MIDRRVNLMTRESVGYYGTYQLLNAFDVSENTD